MRKFVSVSDMRGKFLIVSNDVALRTVAATDNHNLEWILAALNHFANLPNDVQVRLTNDQRFG